jgi:hypothetical protein
VSRREITDQVAWVHWFLKSRQRLGPAGLAPRRVTDKNGRRMSVCARITPLHVSSDPLHHAKSSIEGATHVLRVPTAEGHVYYATHGLPAKTSMGLKLHSLRHPAQHFLPESHGVAIDPQSHADGHSPTEAYFHAVEKQTVRGADGEYYGVILPHAPDANGTPTRYSLVRSQDHQFFGRMAGRRSPKGQGTNWGGGISLSPVEHAYLQSHPPRQGAESGPDGKIFANWSRLELPAVDADGKPIEGRAPRVRYDIRLGPAAYGANYEELRSSPARKIEGEAPVAERRFRQYVSTLRGRLFPREDDRQPAGTLADLLAKHQGNIDALIASGDLGHENAAGSWSRKQRLIVAKKPLEERDAMRLVTGWMAQRPGVVQSLHQYAQRKFPVLNDAAVIDSAIEGAVLSALHRFDPKRGKEFVRYAWQMARGAIAEAAQHRGATYGAERASAGLDPKAAPTVRQRDRAAARAAYEKHGGSQAAFEHVLADALADDPPARRAMAALYPTGDFAHGTPFREVAQHTGIAIPDLLRLRDRSVDGVRRSPGYHRYYHHHLKPLDEERESLERSLERAGPAARLHLAIRSVVEDELHAAYLARLREEQEEGDGEEDP